jgi:ABC-2 type transport system ATP-binding protein
MTTPLVEVAGLTYDYPGRRALADVTFELPAGSITALVGPNGAGKTTLMRCLAALDEPLRGSIRLRGEDALADPPATHRNLGYLPDLFGLYERLSIRRCLTYRAWAQGVPKSEVRAAVQWAADRTGLADRMEEAAGTLSRGLKQRLAIAQAIIHRPPLLILDEPASGLDPEARLDLAQLLRDLRDGGMTLLVSSHILAELEDYSSHLMIIDGGRLVSFEPLAGATGQGARHGAGGEVAVEVRLLPGATSADLAGALAAGQATELVDGVATLTLPDDPAAQAAALAALVRAGLPVVSFAPVKQSLQAAYLGRVREARR